MFVKIRFKSLKLEPGGRASAVNLVASPVVLVGDVSCTQSLPSPAAQPVANRFPLFQDQVSAVHFSLVGFLGRAPVEEVELIILINWLDQPQLYPAAPFIFLNIFFWVSFIWKRVGILN